MITAADEQQHAPTDDAAWQESYYFNWADEDGRYLGLTRLGFNPSTGTADGLVVTIRDGALEYLYPGVGVALTPDEMNERAERGLSVGDLSYTMREPLTRWHIRLTGRTELDATWTALGPPHDYHPQDGDTGAQTVDGRTADAHHFEQVGMVAGNIRINGRDHEINAMGQRDKSWGVRDWSAISGWEWITGHFGPDFSFNATLSLVHDQGEPTGFVMRDGVNHALTSVQVDYEWSSVPNVPAGARLLLVDETGTEHRIRARALAQVPLVKKGLFLQETHARFDTRIDGTERVGVGIVEHAWHSNARSTLRRLPDLAPVLGKAIREKLRCSAG